MRSIRALGCSALVAGCCTACVVPLGAGASGAPRSPDSGLVLVYVRAPGGGAGKARLRIEGVSLLRPGGETPLSVGTREIGGGPASAARLLAQGAVPPGRYEGLVLRAASNGKTGEDSPSGDGLRAALSFPVNARQGVVIEAQVELRRAEGEGGGLEPVLSAQVAVLPALGAMGLVSSAADDAVLVVDKRDGRAVAVVPTGRGPAGLAIDPERRRAYVVTSSDAGVEAIDLDQPSVLERAALQMGDEPVELELLPDRRTLAVVNRGSGTLAFVDTEGLVELDRIAVGNGPTSLLVERNGQRAWVFNNRGSSVSVVDLRSRQLLGTIPVDSGPVRGQFNRTQDRLWVLHDGTPYLTCIDTRTRGVVERLNLGAGASALRVDPLTDRIYVARGDGTGIDVYDPVSLLPVDSLALSGRVGYLAIDAETRLLAAAMPEERRVQALGLVTRARVWTADAGDPAFISFLGER